MPDESTAVVAAQSHKDTEDIDRSIEIMIDDGVYNTPEPYQNLEYGKVKIQQAYLFYKNQNAPEERLELLRRWISDADELQKRTMIEMQRREAQVQQDAMATEQAAAMGAPAGAAPGVPVDTAVAAPLPEIPVG